MVTSKIMKRHILNVSLIVLLKVVGAIALADLGIFSGGAILTLCGLNI